MTRTTRTTRPLPGVPLVALRLVGLLLAGLWPSAAEPYVQQTYMGTPLAWADPEVTLTLGLLCIPGPDPCYHAAVVAAAANWNAAGAQFTFQTTSYLADPCAHGDRRNTVSFFVHPMRHGFSARCPGRNDYVVLLQRRNR